MFKKPSCHNHFHNNSNETTTKNLTFRRVLAKITLTVSVHRHDESQRWLLLWEYAKSSMLDKRTKVRFLFGNACERLSQTYDFASGHWWGATYLYVCLWVCLSVCLSARRSQEPNVLTSLNYLYTLPVAVSWSLLDDNAIRYTSSFVDDVTFSHNEPNKVLIHRYSPGGDAELCIRERSLLPPIVLFWLWDTWRRALFKKLSVTISYRRPAVKSWIRAFICGTAKNVEFFVFVFVCLSVCPSRFWTSEIVRPISPWRKRFWYRWIGEGCSCAPVFNFLRLPPTGDITKCRSQKIRQNLWFSPSEGDRIKRSRWNLARKHRSRV